MKYLAFILFALLSHKTLAFDKYLRNFDELQPMTSAYTYHSPKYGMALKELLFNNTNSLAEFQMLIQPAFTAETLLSIRIKEGEYYAQVLKPNGSIWYSDRELINLDMKEKVLPKEIAQEAKFLWDTMLFRTKYSCSWRGVDGVSYSFFSSYGEWKIIELAGQFSNPKDNSKPWLLANIGESIIAYVGSSSKAEERKLEAQIMDLTKEMRKRLNTERVIQISTITIPILCISGLAFLIGRKSKKSRTSQSRLS